MNTAQTHNPQSENALREQIVICCNQLNANGLNTGRAGNLSARWNRSGSTGMLITPSALHYDAMTIDDIVWMPLTQDADQRLYDGQRDPSSEWRMHHGLYTNATDTPNAVLHTHSAFATTLACLPRVQRDGIPAFHYMIAVAGGNSIRCAQYEVFGSQALSEAMSNAMIDRKGCLLANHGQIAMGDSIRDALDLAVEIESLSQMYWQALQIEEPATLTDTQMDEVYDAFRHYSYRNNS